jgi:hypothetical protein
MTEIKDRFLSCVTEHEMNILSESGMFRQITFKKPTSYNYHFHITTWPGYLAISGDAGCYVFARLSDMFEFFRGDHINPSYWSEKLQAVDQNCGYKEFSDKLFHEAIKSDFDEWQFEGDEEEAIESRKNAWAAIQESDISDDETPDSIEDAVRRAMDYKCPVSGNTFGDFWDHNLQDYTFRFLWCCHAIQWAITKYDAAKVLQSVG